MGLLLFAGGLLAFALKYIYPRPLIPASFDDASELRYQRDLNRFYLAKMGLCIFAVILVSLATGVAGIHAQEARSHPAEAMTCPVP